MDCSNWIRSRPDVITSSRSEALEGSRRRSLYDFDEQVPCRGARVRPSLCSGLHASGLSRPPRESIYQALHRLNELGSVLLIAAHPDDERSELLAYFAKGRYMRAAYLSLTRGEGGQNLLGSEQGAALGVLRTQELLAARRIDGGEQFFTRAIDFGFSKSADESIQKWGRDQVVSDIVWIIRRYRPDIVMLGSSATALGGHGHHQASAILGREACDAAGDPARFPGQLRYVQPWKPAKVVTAGFGGGGSVQIDTSGYNPIIGYSYQQLATMSRGQHRSQGLGGMAIGGGMGGGRGGRGGRAHGRRDAGGPGRVRRDRALLETASRRRGGGCDPVAGHPRVRLGASREDDSAAGQGAPADRGDVRPAGQNQARRTGRDHRALRPASGPTPRQPRGTSPRARASRSP